VRRPRPQHWIAACAVGLVVLAGVVELRRTAPGALSAVHEALPELAGMNDCSACHGGLFSDMADACLACHEPIDAQLADGMGLHGSLEGATAGQCARCHGEHHGPRFAIVNAQSFALAGVPDSEHFDHRLVGFEMGGRHLEVDCIGCHAHSRDVVLPAGASRFLGLDAGCASCHEDAHEGRMQLECRSCHGQQSFEQLEPWGHGRVLPLVGGHGGLECAACHAEEGPTSLQALGEAGGSRAAPGTALTAPRDCTSCHESPHAAGLVEAAAAPADGLPGAQCAVCHAAEHSDFGEARAGMSLDRHARTGFPLDSPHDAAACAACHAPDEPDFARRHPGRAPEDCGACHEDPHGGQFDSGPFAAAGCIACHAREAFEPAAFGAEQHALTAFVLDGRHVEQECAACHGAPLAAGPRAFRGAPATCEQCHEDAHEGAFGRFEARRAPIAQGRCARCHDSSAFAHVPPERFVHGDWTAFGLQGAHAQTACESCHVTTAEPDAHGRRFGRAGVALATGSGSGPAASSLRTSHSLVAAPARPDGELRCSSCHADPHGGAFDGPLLPREFQGSTDCARCHDETSFRSLPVVFDHRLWTGFTLQGVHQDAACTSCHAPRVLPDAEGRTWERARGTACADCHADPHGGQFEARAGQQCDSCHLPTRHFSDLRFDHERDSRFKLGEAHADVACHACHEAVDVGGTAIVRYKPLETECVDCHGVQESVLLRRSGRSR